MTKTPLKPHGRITDHVTGRPVADVGAEANRQSVERFLTEKKGYLRQDIRVSAPIHFTVKGEPYASWLDLVVCVDGKPYMAVKCAAGSLGSREREIVAAARLYHSDYPLPLAVVSDGKTAVVLDTVSGKRAGSGLQSIPERDAAAADLAGRDLAPLDPERKAMEAILFRSYDMDNVNRLPPSDP